jgi:hypothetical protein
MPERQLSDYTILQWLTVLGISFWGGMAGYLGNMVKYRTSFKWLEFLEKSIVAVFAGLMIFFLCEAAGVSVYVRESMVGMAGFLGSETLILLKAMFKRRVTAMIGPEPEPEPDTKQEPGRNG